MKPTETQRNRAIKRRHSYTKVLDNRKHPVRGLWRRNGNYVARITVEDALGRKSVKWTPLEAETAAEAVKELRTVQTEREENRLRHIGLAPTFADYLDKVYAPLLESSGKRPETLVTEKSHFNRWREGIGHLRLDKIRASNIFAVLNALRANRSARTCNLALVVLRNVLKAAKRDNYVKTLPTEEIGWQKVEKKAHRLFTFAEIESICDAAAKPLYLTGGLALGSETGIPLKNAVQFSDYIKFLTLTGAREQEALSVRWSDVDLDRKLVTIGAEGQSKNREARRVDFNAKLEAHLRDMKERRAPDSQWVFPSPQRGEKDEHAKTFRESLILSRQGAASLVMKAAFPDNGNAERAAKLLKFAFHDCRHHFISFAVMSGIDFMTIARWVGHKDGGVLIGKVYGHLSNEHAKLQASRMSFGPALVAAVG